jgi:hypothetical protein
MRADVLSERPFSAGNEILHGEIASRRILTVDPVSSPAGMSTLAKYKDHLLKTSLLQARAQAV